MYVRRKTWGGLPVLLLVLFFGCQTTENNHRTKNKKRVQLALTLVAADSVELKMCEGGQCESKKISEEKDINIAQDSEVEKISARSCYPGEGGKEVCEDWQPVKKVKDEKKDSINTVLLVGSVVAGSVAVGAIAAVITYKLLPEETQAAAPKIRNAEGEPVRIKKNRKMIKPNHWIDQDGYKITLKDGKTVTLRVYNPGSPATKIDRDIFIDSLRDIGKVEPVKLQDSDLADINLHIEQRGWTHNGSANIMLANQEFFDVKSAEDMEMVVCRNKACFELVEALRIANKNDFSVQQINFSSKVKESPEPTDFNRFFHPAGKSPHKNTDLLVKAWLRDSTLPQLVVTCYGDCAETLKGQGLLEAAEKAGNIKIHTSFLDKDTFEQYRKIGNVIIPSSAEGFGHSINEARYQGAVILTMDSPPMNELIRGEGRFLLEPEVFDRFGSGAKKVRFKEEDLLEKVRKMRDLDLDTRKKYGALNKKHFNDDTKLFYSQFQDIFRRMLK